VTDRPCNKNFEMMVWIFELGMGILVLASSKLALLESFLPRGTSQYGPPACPVAFIVKMDIEIVWQIELRWI